MAQRIFITAKQSIWLMQLGGRGLNDVYVKSGFRGVYMSSGQRFVDKFYRLPADKSLQLIRTKEGFKDKERLYVRLIKG